ncbi:MAG: hypothetical protein K2N85_07820 [Lachnospiraceae bacterium]|nr:hypothetical protein [Lachnospiraceae bacterium]
MRKLAINLALALALTLALYGCGNTSGLESIDENEDENVNGNTNVNVIINETINENSNAITGISLADSNESRNENAVSPSITEAIQGGPYGRISVSLPDGWSYEACPIDSDALINGMYGIHLYPEGKTNGYIELAYVEFFGVCGTGLETEKATIAGDSANVGTYDNHEYWDFISFKGENEGIVALTYCVDDWWSEYGNQTLDILDTLSYDKDIKEGSAYVYSEESQIEEIGLSLSLKNISSTGATLVFRIYDENAPTGELDCGEDFTIEMQKNGKWEEVPIPIEGNYAFHDVAYVIKGDKAEMDMEWKWIYGELEPGEYRIKKSVDDFRASGDYDEYTVYAQFILN